MKQNKQLLILLGIVGISGVVSLVGVAAIIGTQSGPTFSPTYSSSSTSTASSDTAEETDNTVDTNSSVTTTTSGDYDDGSYSSSVNYVTHHNHNESITVTITLEDGVVTDLNLDQSGTSGESAQYQSRFASSIDSYVVGESIDDISLSRVAGASDTTKAFMEALEDIMVEAA